MAIIIHEETFPQELTVNKGGGHAVRTFVVDLNGVAPSTPDGMVFTAMFDATFTAIVQRGSAHPTMTALYCSELKGKAIDVNKVEIQATYEPFAAESHANNTQTPKLTVSSFIQSEDTNQAADGSDLIVSNSGDPDIVATVSIDTCLVNLSFMRLETAAPIAVQTFVDTLNDADITYRGFLFASGTLKCTGISGNPADDSGNYNVTYTMIYNPNGWQATVYYTQDGNIVPGTGTTYDVYATSTFSSLNLA